MFSTVFNCFFNSSAGFYDIQTTLFSVFINIINRHYYYYYLFKLIFYYNRENVNNVSILLKPYCLSLIKKGKK